MDKKVTYTKLLTVVTLLLFGGGFSCKSQHLAAKDFVPKGHILLDKLEGDLNLDGQRDCVLIIKGTDPNQVVTNRFDQTVDRNRRGIIVLLNKDGQYHMVVNNNDCFYSEHEDGGVYYAPQLSIKIEIGLLKVHFEHGRYGQREFVFKYQDSDFELIGYLASRGGAVTEGLTAIDFLNKKRIELVNTNPDAEKDRDEDFEETETKINIEQLLKLSQIKAFEDLDMSDY